MIRILTGLSFQTPSSRRFVALNAAASSWSKDRAPPVRATTAPFPIALMVRFRFRLRQDAPSFGTGVALKGDIVRLLQSLPEEGNIAVRLSPRTGAALDGSFLLAGLKNVREKVAAACKWPHAVAKPSN
jgi:hypothetical protein